MGRFGLITVKPGSYIWDDKKALMGDLGGFKVFVLLNSNCCFVGTVYRRTVVRCLADSSGCLSLFPVYPKSVSWWFGYGCHCLLSF